jgi:hypothetical protein
VPVLKEQLEIRFPEEAVSLKFVQLPTHVLNPYLVFLESVGKDVTNRHVE